MTDLHRFVNRWPVVSFVVLCYGITWSVWFAIPWFAGDEWTLTKILTGVGLGPGIAAVVLDRLRGTAGGVRSGRWWLAFAGVFVSVTVLNVSSLLTGDAGSPREVPAVQPVGLTPVGVVGSLLCAAVAGFVFASALCSRSATLATIGWWRKPWRWHLVGLLLPAALIATALAIGAVTGGEQPVSPGAGLSTGAWAMITLRSVLFTFLVVTVGEEVGWRGWMQPELQKRFSPLVTSLLIGVVWGLWHFPLYLIGFYPGGPFGVVKHLIFVPVLAVLFTFLYDRSGGVLFTALIFHTAINNTGRILPTPEMVPLVLVAAALVVVFTERMWRREVAASSTEAGPRGEARRDASFRLPH